VTVTSIRQIDLHRQLATSIELTFIKLALGDNGGATVRSQTKNKIPTAVALSF